LTAALEFHRLCAPAGNFPACQLTEEIHEIWKQRNAKFTSESYQFIMWKECPTCFPGRGGDTPRI
jgi:hypothetical protein